MYIDKNPHEITLFSTDLFLCIGFIKTFVLYYFIVLYKGRVHMPWGTCGSQKTNFSSQCSSSAKWVLETPMWISGLSVSTCTLLSPYHIFAVCCPGSLLVGICLFVWLCVCFNRNCLCAIHRTWHISYFNVWLRQKKRKRVRWVGYLPSFASVTSRLGFRTP